MLEEQIYGSILFFCVLFNVDHLPFWHGAVKAQKSQTQIEESFREALLRPPFGE